MYFLAQDDKGAKNYENYAYYKSNNELLSYNQTLENKNKNLKEQIETLKFVIQEKDQVIKNQEEQILTQKNEILQLVNKLNLMTEQRDLAVVKLDQKISRSDFLNERAIVLEKQIESLSDAQLNCEQSIQILLQEKIKLGKYFILLVLKIIE